MTDQPTIFDRLSAAVNAALTRLRADPLHQDDEFNEWDTLEEPEIWGAFNGISDEDAAMDAWSYLSGENAHIILAEMRNCDCSPDSTLHLALCVSLYGAIVRLRRGGNA